MKIDEKTKQELKDVVYSTLSRVSHNREEWCSAVAALIVSRIIKKLNGETVSDAEARSERN